MATWDTFELNRLECGLADVVRERGAARELLERLVDALLVGPVGRESLNTDGLEISRELNAPDGYLAVGHVWMLPNGREPVRVHLVFSEDGTTVLSGTVHFGLSPDRPTAPAISHAKAVKLLLAYPEESAQRVPWAYVFQRTSSGWSVSD